MDITESENRLEDTSSMSIHFLNTVERTLTDRTRECWYLIDTDDTRISDDEEIEFIIDPVEEHKREEHDPVEWESTPIEPTPEYVDNRLAICDEDPWRQKKHDEIEKVKNEDYPVTVEGEEDVFVFSEEGDVFFFDHVMCGSLR